MIPFGKLAKLAVGQISEDEFKELLALAGFEGQWDQAPEDRKADAFQRVAQSAVSPDAKVTHIRMVHKTGARLEGVLVLTSPRPAVMRTAEKVLDAANGITLPSCQLP